MNKYMIGKMKALKKVFLLIFVLAGCLVSCEKETLDPGDFNFDDPVSFEQDIIPIFESKCISCHGGGRAPDVRAENAYESLTTGGYVNIGEPELSKIMKVFEGSHSSRATEIEQNKILAWIIQGAKND